MTASNYQVRRATIDDLAALRRLWQQAGLSAPELEKRLTEFQVVETPQGEILGAIGVQVIQQNGRIHSEAYSLPETAAELRARLWERLQALARNHGLTRLWIHNSKSVLWLEQGFEPAGSELLKKLPEPMRSARDGQWFCLKLRDETAAAALAEHELQLFRQAQKDEGQRIARQTRVLRTIAGLITAILLVILGCAIWYAVQQARRNSGF